MELTSLVANQILIMFILIAIGYICFKINLITAEVNKKLSALVLYLISPALILSSYQIEFKTEYLNGLLISLACATGSILASIIIAQILVRKPQKYDVAIERFAIIYSNCGFIGIPIVNSIYGAKGVFYLTAYITMFNILLWTHGVMLMNNKFSLKQLLVVAKSPTIIAIILGLLFFVTRITLPKNIGTAVKYIADMNTPMAMIVAGATVAQTNIGKALIKPRIYLASLIRLIIVPLATLLVLNILPIEKTILIAIVIAAACPTGASVTLFALNYNKNSLYASELFAVTTLLSAVTLPLIVLVSGLI